MRANNTRCNSHPTARQQNARAACPLRLGVGVALLLLAGAPPGEAKGSYGRTRFRYRTKKPCVKGSWWDRWVGCPAKDSPAGPGNDITTAAEAMNVNVHHASNIPAVNPSSMRTPSSDPYVRLTLLDAITQRPKGAAVSSGAKWADLNPVWNETLSFEGLPCLDNQTRADDIVLAVVMDNNWFKADVAIGYACARVGQLVNEQRRAFPLREDYAQKQREFEDAYESDNAVSEMCDELALREDGVLQDAGSEAEAEDLPSIGYGATGDALLILSSTVGGTRLLRAAEALSVVNVEQARQLAALRAEQEMLAGKKDYVAAGELQPQIDSLEAAMEAPPPAASQTARDHHAFGSGPDQNAGFAWYVNALMVGSWTAVLVGAVGCSILINSLLPDDSPEYSALDSHAVVRARDSLGIVPQAAAGVLTTTYAHNDGDMASFRVRQCPGGLSRMARTVAQLAVRSNDIRSLSGLDSFSNLSDLDLSDNDLASLSGLEAIGRTLRKLRVDNNDIARFANGALPNLSWLSARSNDLKALTAADARSMPGLTYLDLANNDLTDIRGVGHYAELEFLDVCNNDLRSVDGVLESQSLEVVLLRKNHFHLANNASRSASRNFHLAFNASRSALIALANLPALKLVDLRQNSLGDASRTRLVAAYAEQQAELQI